jgi:hypothetical protein
MKLTILNYKNWAANIIFIKRIKKISLKTYHHFVANVVPPPERTQQVGSNATMKGYTTIPKKTAQATRTMTRNPNKTKYHWASSVYI